MFALRDTSSKAKDNSTIPQKGKCLTETYFKLIVIIITTFRGAIFEDLNLYALYMQY